MAANHRSIPAHVPLVLLAKGVEVGTLLTPYEVVKDCLPTEKMSCVAVMSGPSFAKEVSQGQPTNVGVAAFDPSLVVRVQAQINNANSNFRVYASDDVIGCEIAGAVKNVLAIASGASSGLGFGNNTRAGLICRGLAEMTRLAKAMGSNGRAMSGLAGGGDLLLTCSSELSRNFSVGQRLARGDSTDSILNSTGPVAEGVATAKSVHNLAKKLGVEMPICEQVYEVIWNAKSVSQAVGELMDRTPGEELDHIVNLTPHSPHK
jgi:glycerol-3-phosphate dehydrogenase